MSADTAIDLDRDLPLLGILPGPERRAEFRFFAGDSPLGPDFGFTMILPRSWTAHPPTGVISLDEGPAPLGVFSERPDMLPPTLLSLGVLRANTHVSLLTFYAAYCHISEQRPAAMRPLQLDAFRGVDGLIDTPDGLRMRLLMFEDGGRVMVIAGTSPIADYRAKAPLLATLMFSVEFAASRGPTMTIVD